MIGSSHCVDAIETMFKMFEIKMNKNISINKNLNEPMYNIFKIILSKINLKLNTFLNI